MSYSPTVCRTVPQRKKASSEQPDGKQYCAKCLALTGTLECLLAACSEAGYAHWSSWDELESSSKTCELCDLVLFELPLRTAKDGAATMKTHAVLGKSLAQHEYVVAENEQALTHAGITGFVVNVLDPSMNTRDNMRLYASIEPGKTY